MLVTRAHQTQHTSQKTKEIAASAKLTFLKRRGNGAKCIRADVVVLTGVRVRSGEHLDDPPLCLGLLSTTQGHALEMMGRGVMVSVQLWLN